MQELYTLFGFVCLGGLLEGFGIPWPGGWILAGVAAGMRGSAAAVAGAVGLYTAGYWMGAVLQYFVGWKIGPLAISWLPAHYRTKLERLTTQYGSAAVLWLRPLAVGNYVSLSAGMVRMPLSRFTLYTLLGIGPWATGLGLAGALFGDHVHALSTAAARWLPALPIAPRDPPC